MSERGYLEGKKMAPPSTAALEPTDRGLSFINNYLKGQERRPFYSLLSGIRCDATAGSEPLVLLRTVTWRIEFTKGEMSSR